MTDFIKDFTTALGRVSGRLFLTEQTKNLDNKMTAKNATVRNKESLKSFKLLRSSVVGK